MIKYINTGHFSLYKNVQKVNEIFMKYIDEKKKPMYKNVFTSSKSFFFDEQGTKKDGIVNFFERNNYKIYIENDMIADINIKYNNLFISTANNFENGKNIFEYKIYNGKSKLIAYYNKNSEIKQKEYMYIHLQKRKMEVKTTNKENFIIIPNKFIYVVCEKIDKRCFNKFCKRITILRSQYISLMLKRMVDKVLKGRN